MPEGVPIYLIFSSNNIIKIFNDFNCIQRSMIFICRLLWRWTICYQYLALQAGWRNSGYGSPSRKRIYNTNKKTASINWDQIRFSSLGDWMYSLVRLEVNFHHIYSNNVLDCIDNWLSFRFHGHIESRGEMHTKTSDQTFLLIFLLN